MPETRVPMTLREHFLQDPFFKSAWDDMERMRSSFFQTSSTSSTNMLESSGQQQRAEVSSNQEKSLAKSSEDRFGKWLVPRTWMLPSLLDNDKMTDSSVLSYSDTEHKLEISLNTSGYKAEEIKVNINGDELCVEGRHEERSEAGHVMVSRQFTKSYSLPQGAIKEKVESNLSQDGVLVITVPKEKKIQEIKNERSIAVEHKNNKAAENINVERKSSSGSMERERKLSSASAAERKISTGSMERKSSMEKMSSMERKSSLSGSSSTLGSEKSKKTTSMVPMNLRDSFFDDPFFQDNWLDIQKTQKNFFTQAQEQFRQQRERMESSMSESKNLSSFFDKDFALTKFDDDFFKLSKDSGFSKLDLKDAHELSVKETEESLEIKLDTAGFKPDELRVTAGAGVICVEGKHEEKTEGGVTMVSRMMSRQYPLPAQARPSDVVSNLSKDGILVVTVPKSKQIKQGERNVPIEMNN